MEQNILYSMGKEGGHLQFKPSLVPLLSKSLEPVMDMHNNDCVICSCGWDNNCRELYNITGYNRTREIARVRL